MLTITETDLQGVWIMKPQYFEDNRGYYVESYSSRTLQQLGIDTVFVQDCHSYSAKRGTVRGIHLQVQPKAQTKLVRCTRGRILDVAVDLREDSPNYCKWIGIELSEENHRQLWIPKGFGHGFLTLTDHCELQYKVDCWYFPEADRSIAWNDPQLGIEWPVENPILSPKDAAAPCLSQSDVHFFTKDF